MTRTVCTALRALKNEAMALNHRESCESMVLQNPHINRFGQKSIPLFPVYASTGTCDCGFEKLLRRIDDLQKALQRGA